MLSTKQTFDYFGKVTTNHLSETKCGFYDL